MKREVGLSTTGTITSMVRFLVAGGGRPRIAEVENRDPSKLIVRPGVVAFEYFDRLTAEYSGERACEDAKPFRSVDLNPSGKFFVEPAVINARTVRAMDGTLHAFVPGRDQIVRRKKFVFCVLEDGSQNIIPARKLDRSRGMKMARRLPKGVLFYYVFTRLCGNPEVRLTPRRFLAGMPSAFEEVVGDDNIIPDNVRGQEHGRGTPIRFVLAETRFWAVYVGDILPREPISDAAIQDAEPAEAATS